MAEELKLQDDGHTPSPTENIINPVGMQDDGHAPLQDEGYKTDVTQPPHQTVPAENVGIEDEGLSDVEIHDPNKIKIEIADKTTPIVVLYGPPSCGKTMILIRLTRYLKSNGYTVEPDDNFRPKYDNVHKKLCENFDEIVFREDAAEATSHINFMLLKVMRKGGIPICQILEGPGELYFNPKDTKAKYPKYLNHIKSAENRKIWTVITEPSNENILDSPQRAQYSGRVGNLKTMMSPRDKVLFVLNKVDLTHLVYSPGEINYKEAIKETEQWYPSIFTAYENHNPITSFWKKYNCDFIAFQTGDFSPCDDGKLAFTPGDDIYPKLLWEKICKLIKG